jgi:hypothetical protein
VTSIDFLKRERPLRLFRECLPAPGEPAYPRRFDLMIVDEAANVAPAGTGHYATDSLRTMAIRTLSPHFEHKLFLTATPHNGYPESFSALLQLLDDQRFAQTREIDPKQLEVVMVHRLKTELADWDGQKRFQERRSRRSKSVPGFRASGARSSAAGELRRARLPKRQNVATDFVLKP